MQIEIFEESKHGSAASGLDVPDCTAFENYAALEEFKLRIKLNTKLGLTAQNDIVTPLYIAYSLKAKIPYPFLTKEQETVLKRFFPTRYIEARPYHHTPFCLSNYRYDLIPLPVLVAWNQARERQMFSAMEIWTAEARELPDPVLIGRRREHGFVYLCARWGETLETWQDLARDGGELPALLSMPAGRMEIL